MSACRAMSRDAARIRKTSENSESDLPTTWRPNPESKGVTQSSDGLNIRVHLPKPICLEPFRSWAIVISAVHKLPGSRRWQHLTMSSIYVYLDYSVTFGLLDIQTYTSYFSYWTYTPIKHCILNRTMLQYTFMTFWHCSPGIIAAPSVVLLPQDSVAPLIVKATRPSLITNPYTVRRLTPISSNSIEQ